MSSKYYILQVTKDFSFFLLFVQFTVVTGELKLHVKQSGGAQITLTT